MPAWSGVSTFSSGGWMSQTALSFHVVGFVGGAGPATGTQQHLRCSNDVTRPAEGALLLAGAQGFL